MTQVHRSLAAIIVIVAVTTVVALANEDPRPMTARDLALVGRMVAEGGTIKRRKILKPASIRLLGTPGPQKNQGLLWRLRLGSDGETVKGYYHTGWLGQFLVVYPDANLVGVRLRRWKNERDAEKPAYQLGRFLALMDALAGV